MSALQFLLAFAIGFAAGAAFLLVVRFLRPRQAQAMGDGFAEYMNRAHGGPEERP